MSETQRARRLLKPAIFWIALPGLAVFGLYRLYRWAEPSPAAFAFGSAGGGATVTVRLEAAPFAGYSQGRKAWSLFARQIDLERMAGAALSNVQSATLLGIKDGMLYQLPPDVSAAATGLELSSSPLVKARTADKEESPVATFQAGRGRYALMNADPIPPDLGASYNVDWQFKLLDGVQFRTRDGDRLTANALTILNMRSRQTNRPERRIVCDSGATVTHKDIIMQANQVRYDPSSRFVECLGGVRGTFKEGVVQTERAYWSLREQILRCPDVATGTLQGSAFTAEGLVIDLKQHTRTANRLTMRIRIENQNAPRLP